MEFIKLQADNSSAIINITGAEMSSFVANGIEYIWQGDPQIWSGHGPILFPIIGFIKDGKTRISGKEYEITKHGFVRYASFEIVEKGINFVVLSYQANNETRKQYPFEFKLFVRYEINSSGFQTTFTIENNDEHDMPICLGGHPAFNCPIEKEASFTDYDVCFAEKEDGENTLVNEKGLLSGKEILPSLRDFGKISLNHTYFDTKDTLLLTNLKSRSVKLINRNTGCGINFDFDSFPVLAIWSKPNVNAPYVCLEPWLGLPDPAQGETAMEDKEHAVIIKPKHSIKLSYQMQVLC